MRPYCIRVTTENNATSVYVHDFTTRTITRLSEELEVLQKFKYLARSYDLDSDDLVPAGGGQLLVSDRSPDNSKLLVLDTNTGEIKKLLEPMYKAGDYILSARVAFCPRLGRVYLNTGYLADRESDFINVYEIS